MPRPRQYHVYVIELDPAVLESKAFREANAGYREGRPCVYVGQSVRTPAERLAQHRSGVKANRFARRPGLRLLTSYSTPVAGGTREAAEAAERAMAERLRSDGWGVWSH